MLHSPSTSVIRYFLCGYFKIYVKAHKIGRGQIFKSRKSISIQGVICHCFCVYLPCYAHDNCNYNGNLYSSNYCCNKDMRKLLSAWDNVKNTKVCLFTVLSSISWFTPAKQKEYFLESVICQQTRHFADEISSSRWLQVRKSWCEGKGVVMLGLGNGLNCCGKRRDRAGMLCFPGLGYYNSGPLWQYTSIGNALIWQRKYVGSLLNWGNI